MHVIKSIILALATTASATYFNGELLRREVLKVRQTPSIPTATATASTNSTNSTNACSSVLQGLATLVAGLPVPTGALSTYLATAATTLTNPCSLSVPSSVASAFSIYESAVISFYSAHSSQLNSALAACPSLTSLVANPVCSTAASTSIAYVTVNASPRETGVMAVAVAAAGLLGAVVVAL